MTAVQKSSDTVRITHYGHACVLVELDERRIVIDPGSLSTGYDDLRNVDLILITHQHLDHVVPERLAALLEVNPQARVITNASVEAALAIADARVVTVGERLVEAGIALSVTGPAHGVIHPDVPAVENTGFVVGNHLWHPGDSLETGERTVPILLVPIGGPWMKLSEAIEFTRAVAPAVAIPIHQSGLADVHREMHYGLLRSLAPSSTEVVVLQHGVPTEIHTDRVASTRSSTSAARSAE